MALHWRRRSTVTVTPDLFEEMGAIRLKAVITVLGKDRPGIIAKIATALYEREVNKIGRAHV